MLSKMIICICVLFQLSISQLSNVEITGTSESYNGKYAPDHVWVIWIVDINGDFIKTLNGRGNKYANKNQIWSGHIGNPNDRDGYTGASTGTHGTITGTWDMTDQMGNMVPAGIYHFYLEMNETNNESQWVYGEINIDYVEKTVTSLLQTNQYWTNVSVKYTPGKIPQKLNIDYSSSTIEELMTSQLSANLDFDDNSNEEVSDQVTWSSSDKNILVVDEKGNITAISPGTANIISEYSSTISETVSYTITPTTETLIGVKITTFHTRDYVGINNVINLKLIALYTNSKEGDKTTLSNWVGNGTNGYLLPGGALFGITPGLMGTIGSYNGIYDTLVINVLDYQPGDDFEGPTLAPEWNFMNYGSSDGAYHINNGMVNIENNGINWYEGEGNDFSGVWRNDILKQELPSLILLKISH
jgi:hypothetical protein